MNYGYQQQPVYNQGYQQGYAQPQQGYMQPQHGYQQVHNGQTQFVQQPMHHPQQPYQQPQMVQQQQPRPKVNQIVPQSQPKAKKDSPRAKVNFGGEDSSSDSDVRFVGGRSYCCGLINTGDSICMNCCKIFIVFVVFPLALYWLYTSGHLKTIADKAGDALSGGCKCCRKLCATVSGKLNDMKCLNKVCNSKSCKHCCGLQRFFEGICSCGKHCCRKGCFSGVTKFCGKILTCKGLKECCGPCWECTKKGLKCSAIGNFFKGLCKCDFDKLSCCNPEKGCKNMFQCFGDCPCCKKCGKYDTCSCCNRAGFDKAKGCFGQCKERLCNCCYSFKKKAGEKGASLKSNWGRGRYKPKSKFWLWQWFMRPEITLNRHFYSNFVQIF